MFTTVLLTAMTAGSPPVAGWGGRNYGCNCSTFHSSCAWYAAWGQPVPGGYGYGCACTGCCGGMPVPLYGCAGVGYGYHGGCYGAYGVWQGDILGGCTGCYGCHGGYSCYGIPVPIPTAPVAPVEGPREPFPPINPPGKKDLK